MGKNTLFLIPICLLSITAVFFASAAEPELKTMQLPKPQTDGGRPLMQVLSERQTSREFSTEKLPEQVLSNLLWAAFGINRPESGKLSDCPHYDSQTLSRQTFRHLIASGELLPGIAADDGAAVHYIGTKLHEAVSSRPNARAYLVKLSNGEVIETPLETQYLGK